jgi:hypothetical protein
MAFTYSIATDPEAMGRDADNADFSIANPDVLELSANAPLAAGTKKVTVKSTDAGSGEFGYAFLNVVINPSVTALTLNQTNTPTAGDPQGTLVGALQVTGGTGSFTFALVAGTGDTDNTHYQITGSNVELSASGGSTDPTDSIRVEVTDSTGYKFEQALTVNINSAATTVPPPPSLTLCGSDDGNPSMEITVTGISDGTPFLGCSGDWDNGETKEVFVDSVGTYQKDTGEFAPGYVLSEFERWDRQTTGGDRFRMFGFASAAAGYAHTNAVRWDASHRLAWGTGGFISAYSNGVSAYNPNGANPFGGPWSPQYTTPGFALNTRHLDLH